MYQRDEVVADRHSSHAAPEYRPDEVLPNYLEADQLAAETSRPVPRAVLSGAATVALWALRVFVVITSVMVIYVFISQLAH